MEMGLGQREVNRTCFLVRYRKMVKEISTLGRSSILSLMEYSLEEADLKWPLPKIVTIKNHLIFGLAAAMRIKAGSSQFPNIY